MQSTKGLTLTTTDVPTFCRICEPMCGLIATVEDGRLAGLRPDYDDPHSQGFCCVKGLSMTQIVNDPAALRPGYRPWLSGGWMAVLFRPTFPSRACSRTAIPRPLADWRSSTATAPAEIRVDEVVRRAYLGTTHDETSADTPQVAVAASSAAAPNSPA